MESILKNLYYGNFNLDDIIYAKDPEYLKISNQALEAMESLKKNVPEEEYKNITNLLELHTELGALEVANAFEYGYKYGSLIMMEILKDTDPDI